MPDVIDADTHIIESEQIWEFFDRELSHRRPALVSFADPGSGLTGHRWVIDGALFPKPHGRGGMSLATPPMNEQEAVEADWACRSLASPETRLAHKDRMGVGVQVIYPTLFIAYLTEDAALEVALCRAYNRFMADVWSRGRNELRWVVVPPLRSTEASIEEMNFGKEHGAVGVLFRGMEGELSLADPSFYPIYGEASRLNLPVCVHTGAGSSTFTAMCDSRYTSNFAHIRLLPLIAFHDIVHNKIPERFPDLRFGFIEATASWVPFLLHFFRRKTKRDAAAAARLGPQLFRDYRLFVACEADEDIPYLLNHIGEDNLLIGSDYGHHDQSAEPDLVSVIRSRADIPSRVVEKMLSDNPRRFYPLD
jgi:predicted TIM-barrel fold metal-dependent hydrolase